MTPALLAPLAISAASAVGSFFTSKTGKYFLLSVAALALIYFFYKWAKKQGAFIQYPDSGTGIPAGWSPEPVVGLIHQAFEGGWFFGAGTNEDQFFNALAGLTPDQLAAVYNAYLNKYNVKLIDAIESEMSGDDLSRALYIFSPVIK